MKTSKNVAIEQIGHWTISEPTPSYLAVKLIDSGPISGSFFIDGIMLAVVLITVGFFLGKIK